eukprot:jgi/Astpho2/8777/e_gw1.00128.94.1_t
MGVFDGHGVYGGKVSSHVRNAFAEVLGSMDGRRVGQDPRKALWTAFRDVHESLSALPYNLARSGTTAVVCIVTKKWVATAWAGDSRAVLAAGLQQGGHTLEAVDVSQDHKPKDPREERRINACGGRVDRLVASDNVVVGPYRVFLRDSWSPGLACSRALGDVMAAQAGVTWRPSIDVRELKPTDEYLVLASDGVWELLSSQEGLDIAGSCPSSKEAAAALVQRSRERWATIQSGQTCDDVTAIVCRLH